MTEHALLTDIEAARWLRLTDDGRNDAAALQALNRLVDQKLLRPCIVGKRRRYFVPELERFVMSQIERYGATR